MILKAPDIQIYRLYLFGKKRVTLSGCVLGVIQKVPGDNEVTGNQCHCLHCSPAVLVGSGLATQPVRSFRAELFTPLCVRQHELPAHSALAGSRASHILLQLEHHWPVLVSLVVTGLPWLSQSHRASVLVCLSSPFCLVPITVGKSW